MAIPVIAGVVAVAKGLHAWSRTQQGRAVIAGIKAYAAYEMHKRNPTPVSGHAVSEGQKAVAKDIVSPVITSVSRSVADQYRRMRPGT